MSEPPPVPPPLPPEGAPTPPVMEYRCPRCNNPVDPRYSVCPYCGYSTMPVKGPMPAWKVLLIIFGTLIALAVLAVGACLVMISTSR